MVGGAAGVGKGGTAQRLRFGVYGCVEGQGRCLPSPGFGVYVLRFWLYGLFDFFVVKVCTVWG